MKNLEEIWNKYNHSWKTTSESDKKTLFTECLSSDCQYNDPLATTSGWDELLTYMSDFHQQFPGAYFVTHYFLAHNNQSIAKWEMKNGENETLGDGISYGRYGNDGKLVSMTGFFETPE